MKRVATALILIPVFAYLILWAPQWAFMTALAAVALLCFHEYSGLVSLHAIAKPGLFGYAAGLALLFAPQNGVAFLPLIALLALCLALRTRDLPEALPFAACLTFGVIYIFGSLRSAADLRAISAYWCLFALSLNWAGDIAAFYVGRLIGRHKLAPRISPAKSWEGAVASVIASVIYAALYFPRLLPAVPWWEALSVAAIGNAAGQLGDLSESALKRGAGVKDSGSFLPGHGGWLDRLDSSLFALPVVYLLVSAFRP
jgi:phosphatidate cytidylyltransferase